MERSRALAVLAEMVLESSRELRQVVNVLQKSGPYMAPEVTGQWEHARDRRIERIEALKDAISALEKGA